MHVLMAAFGSAGDVHPFLAIGQALARRGAQIELMASPFFERAVREAGLGFVPAGRSGDYERLVRLPQLWHPTRGFALIARELQAQLPAAVEAARQRLRPDTLLVGSTLAWNLRLLAEQTGRPSASVHLAPSCILSAQAPPLLPGLAWLRRCPPGLARRLLRGAERALLDPMLAPELNRVRAGLGLAPVAHVMSHWIHAPGRVIGAWPDWWAAPQADWPPNSEVTGFPRWRSTAATPTALDPALAAFLDAGPPPVGITPGSAMAHGAVFFRRALAACEALGRRALLITPYAEQLPAPLPADSHHVGYVPFEQVLPRLAGFVHHGGIGSCAQALAAGVPQLVCPFAHDQFDNADRVQRLGVGRSVRQGATAPAWTVALAATVDAPAVRAACAAVAGRIEAAGDAADLIAQRLLSLVPSAHPQRAPAGAASVAVSRWAKPK